MPPVDDGAACPVPVSATVCGLPAAPSTSESVPVRAPVAVGVKLTATAQLAPAASVVPQLWAALKSPEAVMLESASWSVPVLVM